MQSFGASQTKMQRPASRNSMASPSVRPGSRESSKENLAPPDADEYEKYRKEIETLKAEIGTLQYRMQTTEQEKEIALSAQANKMEQVRRREQEETQSRQAAEAAQAKASEEVDEVRREMDGFQEAAKKEKSALERRVRQAADENTLLEEQLQDITSAKDEAARIADKKLADAQVNIPLLESTISDMRVEEQARATSLQESQQQIAERDDAIAALEADVLRLKAQSGDAETMQIIKKELSEQVQHMRALESTNREQLSELKRLRSNHRAVEVVEEQKLSLQRRVESINDLEAELAEAKNQRQRLEDERLSWTAYLKTASGDNEFDSPEALARALAEERMTTANYVEKLGEAQGEISGLQASMRVLAEEKKQLRSETEEAKASANAAGADKARLRLERQRALAIMEVEHLRAQLQTFDTEDQTMQPEQFDESKATRIRELEGLVDTYKTEVQGLHKALATLEGNSSAPVMSLPSGLKRPREDDGEDDQLGQLSRKNRKLQQDLSSYQTKIALLETDVQAAREQLSAVKEQSKTRVLSLRSNPTSDYEAIKRATLQALRKENEDLLATLQSKRPDPSIPMIPTSVLGAMEREIAAAKAETASAQKSARRLKEVWGSKSQEFKEAIFSTLGWTVTFIPNGKMRVESTFLPSCTDEHENSIVFDGERGTMKVGGGPKSAFARRIADQIGFWVREKGCIPGFLAALTLEFYDEHTRAPKTP